MSLTRRDLLKSGGALGAAAVLPGTALARAASAKPSYASLAKALHGDLVLHGGAGYADAARAWNSYAQGAPRAIAFCEGTDDVARVLRFAAARGYAVAPRSGRHSFAGYSCADGVVVADVSRLHAVTLDAAHGTAKIGAGANVQGVYEAATLRGGVAVAHGTCPTVGMAGLTLGGGISRMVRRIGTTSDQLVSAEVVLPDGRVEQVSATRLPDLFWALRGGGGGNFAVVTSLTLKTQPTPQVIKFALTFDWAKAGAALDAWQRSLPTAGRDLSVSTFRALKDGSGKLSATVGGHWYGGADDLRTLLGPLLAVGPKSDPSLAPTTWAAANEPDACDVAPSGGLSCTVDRYPNRQRSAYVAEPISAAQIATLLGFVERWPGGAGSHEGGVQLEALGPGSAVNAIAPTATAFVHRRSLAQIAYLNFWGQPQDAAANVRWVRDVYAAMAPSHAGGAYQNYIDPDLKDWRSAYYGDNLPRLQAIRRKYDPHHLLRFAQGL